MPTPPVVLVAELTGRNCNVILLDEQGTILGAAREVTAEVNRFRQVRAGLAYTPPPPYDKLDPRDASDAELTETLTGKRLKKLRTLVDGVGPDLTNALAISAGVSLGKELESSDLAQVIPALRRIVAEPSTVMKEALELPDVDELRRREARAAMLERLRNALNKEVKLLENRLADVGQGSSRRRQSRRAARAGRHSDGVPVPGAPRRQQRDPARFQWGRGDVAT